MAATIAYATGGDSTREKETHRIGSKYASGKAATWHTTAEVTVFADGHGIFTLKRDGYAVCEVSWDGEKAERPFETIVAKRIGGRLAPIETPSADLDASPRFTV
jgi:hypothetical protein